MVSLAFVISFVASAVALLIGIVVYSDIQDDLAGTFAISPEVNQNLGQNTATSDQPIPTNTTNLSSVYTGLNDTDFVTGVTIPISGVTSVAGGQTNVTYACDSNGGGSNSWWTVDKSNGSVLTTQTVSGITGYGGCQGMAVDPTDGTFYIIFASTIDGERYLATIDPTTAVGTQIGIMGTVGASDSIYNSLAIDSSGNLWAGAGAAHLDPDSIATVNKSTGFATKQCILPSDGTLFHQFFFDDFDNFYHIAGSGFSGASSDMRIEQITNTSTCTVSAPVNFVGVNVLDRWEFLAHENQALPAVGILVSSNPTEVNFDMGSAVAGRTGQSNLWKVFNATDIDGETLNITWDLITGGLANYSARVEIFDGDYGLASDQVSAGANQGSCSGVCKFPQGSAMTTFGSGLLQTGITNTADILTPTLQSFVINTSGATDPSGKVTVFVRQQDTVTTSDTILAENSVDLISITNVGSWEFGNADGSTLTVETTSGSVSRISGFTSEQIGLMTAVGVHNYSCIWGSVEDLAFCTGFGTTSLGTGLAFYSVNISTGVVDLLGTDTGGSFDFTKGLGFEFLVGVSGLPAPYEVGIYDSSNNLLVTDSGTVTVDTPQNLVVGFGVPPQVPTDGTVSVGIFGDGINYLGDTTTADFDSGVAGIEDPFVSDGTVASSQRTILALNQPQSGGVNPEFAQANNVALTVLGVLPVALFFALFTILSPKVDGAE